MNGLLKSLSGKASFIGLSSHSTRIREKWKLLSPDTLGFQFRCRAGAEVDASPEWRPRELSLFPSEGGLGEHPAEDRVDGSQ
jgi:hypothetical protein